MNIKNYLQDGIVKNIIKNTGIVLFGNTSATFLSLISFSLVSKTLGPELLAVMVLAQTYILIFNDIFNIQTWESTVKFGSMSSADNRFEDFIKTNFILDITGAAVGCVCAFLFSNTVANIIGWNKTVVEIIPLYSLSILFNLSSFTIGIPRLFNKFSSVAKIQIFIEFIKLFLVLSAVALGKSLIYFVFIYLVIDISKNISLISYSFLLLNKNSINIWRNAKFKIDRQQLNFIWWSNLRTIIRIPVRYFDMIIISFVMPLKMVGIYKVYKEVAGILNRISEPINQSIYPEYAKLIGTGATDRSIRLAKDTILMLLPISLILTLFLALISKFAVGTFFGTEFLTSMDALYLLIALFGISFITVPIDSLFIAAGFVRSSFYIVVFTNIIYLFISFFFGKLIGINGILIAFAAQLVLNKGLKILFMKKYSSGWSSIIR